MRRVLWSMLLLLALPLSAQAVSMTIGTFSDPVLTPPPFLFQYQDTTNNAVVDGTLTGGYSGANLDLIFPFEGFTHHPGTTFTITPLVAAPVAGDPNGVRFVPMGGGVGTLTFTQAGTDIMLVTFTSAHRTVGTLSATDLLAGEVVEITVPGSTASFLDPETFAFSFANVVGPVATAEAGNAALIRSTASFTSSAEVRLTGVPEPSTLVLLGLGILALPLVRWYQRS